MTDTSSTVVDIGARAAASPAPRKASTKIPAKKTPPKRAPRQVAAGKTAGKGGAPRPAKSYKASVWPREEVLPPKLCKPVLDLQSQLGLPVMLLLQDPRPDSQMLDEVDDMLVHLIRHQRSRLPSGQPIALVLNSPGGEARCAYGLARIIHRRCGGFTAVVPDVAMSAATLLTLGADKILMGPDASLGPLDAQIIDIETETYGSVLNEVQALERLRAYALESVDETMQLLVSRTGKRVDTLLPHVLRFVSDSMQPLLTKIDVVHYNERARILKVGEEYAVRLLRRLHPLAHSRQDKARVIASTLVESYPEHGFWIDREEAKQIGLAVADTDDKMDAILEALWEGVQGVNAIGMFEEVTP
jgi:hypothetical protein